MRIVLFADSLPPSTDGVARTYSNLVKTLQQKQIDFPIISPFKPDENHSWHDRGIKVNSVPLLGLYKHYRLGYALPQTLNEQLDRFKPDIVHVSSPTFIGHMGFSYAAKKNIRLRRYLCVSFDHRNLWKCYP